MTKHQKLLEAAEAELTQWTFEDLRAIRDSLHTEDFGPDTSDTDDETHWCDIRLHVQVADDVESYCYSVLSGDASYDQDHRGFWGSSCIRPDTDDIALAETARDLVDQAIDHAAWAE